MHYMYYALKSLLNYDFHSFLIHILPHVNKKQIGTRSSVNRKVITFLAVFFSSNSLAHYY